ncbi:MAG TPA: hypothetical protein VKN18_28915, partial [Blastocatellia bacterium]|nr:hypothetical protein [Blastocatellia bacterium]
PNPQFEFVIWNVLKPEYNKKSSAGESSMVRRFCLLAIFSLVFSAVAIGQAARPPAQTKTLPPPPPPATQKLPDNNNQEMTHMPEEMRIKMAIARAEEDHKKILEDVEKLSDLSDEVVKDYGDTKQLSGDDVKKLGTIEKLAKRILTHAGGAEVDAKNGVNEQLPLADAIDMLGTSVANIKKEMTAETRFVVSATVIANSNEVISLSRLIRRSKKTN